MAISRVGATNAASASITGPNGNAGDVIVYHTFRSTAATIPSTDANTTSVGSSSGSTCAYNACYEFCTSGTAASRTFTGATQCVAVRYAGVYGLGAKNFAAIASSPTMAYGAIASPIQGGGASWFVGMGAHRTASNVNTAPTGMATITGASVGTGPMACVFDTNGGAASYAAANVTVNATSGRVANVLELLGANSTLNPYKIGTSLALSAANMTSTFGGTTEANAYGTLPRSGDKRYFKVTVTQIEGSAWPVPGIGNFASLANGADLGNSTDNNNSIGWLQSGQVFLNAIQVGTAETFANGDVLWFAVDDVNKNVWCYKTQWNASGTANPSTNTGGISYSSMNAGPYYPGVTSAIGGEVFTVDFNPSSPPSGLSGFQAWDAMGGNIYNVSASESGSAADTVSSLATLAAAIAEAGAANDNPSNVATLPSAIAEAGSAADNPSSVATLPSAVAEAGSAADAPNGVGVFPRAVGESGAAADTPGSVATLPAAIAETGAAADTVAQGSVFAAAITEAGSAAETETAQLAAAGVVAEAGSAADAETSQASLVAALAEAGAGADSPSSAAVLPSAVSEAAAGADTPGSAAVLPVAVGEAGAAAETVSSAAVLPGAVVEAGNAQDSDDLNPPIPVGISEVASAQDAVSAVLVGVGGVTETVTLTDAPASIAFLPSAVAEAGAAADQVSAQFVFAAALVEHGLAVDLPAALAILNAGVMEAGTAVDSVSQEVPGVTASPCNTLGSAPRVRMLGSAPRIRLLGGSCCP